MERDTGRGERPATGWMRRDHRTRDQTSHACLTPGNKHRGRVQQTSEGTAAASGEQWCLFDSRNTQAAENS